MINALRSLTWLTRRNVRNRNISGPKYIIDHDDLGTFSSNNVNLLNDPVCWLAKMPQPIYKISVRSRDDRPAFREWGPPDRCSLDLQMPYNLYNCPNFLSVDFHIRSWNKDCVGRHRCSRLRKNNMKLINHSHFDSNKVWTLWPPEIQKRWLKDFKICQRILQSSEDVKTSPDRLHRCFALIECLHHAVDADCKNNAKLCRKSLDFNKFL